MLSLVSTDKCRPCPSSKELQHTVGGDSDIQTNWSNAANNRTQGDQPQLIHNYTAAPIPKVQETLQKRQVERMLEAEG